MSRSPDMSVIERISKLTPGQYSVLENIPGPNGMLRVSEHGRYRWLQIGDASIQSLMDIDLPARVLSPTTVLMLVGLAFTEGRRRLLNLGLGGGAIERSLRASDPGMRVETVELDSRVIAAARKHFFLHPNQMVYAQDAEHFVANCADHYDVILGDLFLDSQSAPCLSRRGFFNDIQRCLTAGGVCVMNLLYSDQGALVQILQAAREALPATWLVEVRGHQNVMAYFMQARAKPSATLQRACLRRLTELDAEKLPFDLNLVQLPDPV